MRDLGALEKRVYRTYWNDGLLDLLAAVGVLAIGLFWLWDRPIFAAIVPPLLVPLWGPCRQKFIEPRLGSVEFSDNREWRNRQGLWLIFLIGAGCFVLAVGLYLGRDWLAVGRPIDFIAGLPAFLLGGLAALTAVLLESRRYAGYALVLVLAGTAGAVAGWPPGRILVVAGLVILVAAAAIFSRFMRRNPADAGSTD